MKKQFALLLIMMTITYSQQLYKLPFASSGNSIELTVINKNENVMEDITVEAIEIPAWVKFDLIKQSIPLIKSNGEIDVAFNFHVEKEAVVNKETTLLFKIESKTGEEWYKEIKIIVAPPDKFELFQNYPNPFNPVTTISWQLPEESFVEIKLYDVLGKEVKTLVSEKKEPGYYKTDWNAADNSSGMYIYTMRAKAEDKENVFIKKMLYLK